MPKLCEVAPVLPVRDLAAALDHYRLLGFEVQAYDEAPYGFVRRDGVQLHLVEVHDLDPHLNMSAVYFYVDDADELYAEWELATTHGEFTFPSDTRYGLREGAHLDPDGNLIRFGSSPGR